MAETTICVSCGTELAATKRFCPKCGTAVQGGPTPEVGGGFVSNGTWVRPPEEMVRVVPRGDLRGGLFTAGVQVPRGTVGVVVLDGKVAERLRPGFRTTETVVDRFINAFSCRLDNTSVYLIDLRPILVPLEITAQSGGTSTTYEVLVEARIPEDDTRLLRMFDALVRDKPAITTREVYDELRPRILALATPRLTSARLDPAQRAATETELQKVLQASVGEPCGLEVAVSVAASSTSTTVQLRVGGAATPATKKCVNAGCGVQLESSRKFCGKCGGQQPVMTQPGRSCGKCGNVVAEGRRFCGKCGEPFVPPPAHEAPIYTADSQQVELDVIVRADGQHDETSADRLLPAVASAVSQHLRTRNFADLGTVLGFADLERAIRETVSTAAGALSLTVTSVTLLDMRAKGQEWLLGARAELEREKAGLQVGREWIVTEAQRLDLEQLHLELQLRTQRMQRAHALAQDADALADRQRRQSLLDAEAALEAADANRRADRDLAVDAAQRRERRGVRDQEQADALAGASQRQERDVQAAGFARENERTQAHHEMGLERDVAQHDAALAREAMKLGSERQRSETDDRSYVARSGVDDDAYRLSKLSEAEDVAARRRSDREFDDEARREQLKLEKARKLAELDASISQQDADNALRATQVELDHALRMRQQLEGKSYDQMLAMQATELGATPNGAEVAAQVAAMKKAEADASGGAALTALQKEMYERMLQLQQQMAQQAAELAAQTGAGAQAAAAQQQAMMLQMTQLMQSMAAQQMQTMSTVATAAVGGQRETDAARQTAQSYGARSALNMAQQAMGDMAQVAAAAAAGNALAQQQRNAGSQEAGAVKVGERSPSSCPSCRALLSPEEVFCGECGARRA